MFIQKKYAAIAVKHTDANRKNQGVEFDEALLENYRAMLKEKVNSRNIEEGRELEYDDWVEVYNSIVNIMNSSVELVRGKDEAYKSNVKAYEYVFSALNYLLAITESELGSPEIPVNEFRFNYGTWLSTIIYNKPMAEISEEEVYNSQRRMNADLLQSEKIQPLLEGLNDENNISRNVGELYAEYRALVKRQANHGFIWRLFHMSENAARTELIKELEEVLKNHIPDLNLNSETKVLPTTIGKSAEKVFAVHRFNNSTALYDQNLSDVFGYEENGLDPDPTENDQIESEQIESDQSQNEQSQNEQENIISQPSELEIIVDEDEKVDEIDESVSNEENQNVIGEDNNEEVHEKVNEEVNEEKVNEEEIEEQKNEPVEEKREVPQSADVTAQQMLNAINNDDFKAELAKSIWDAIKTKVDGSVKKEAVMGEIVNKMLISAANVNEIYDDVKSVDTNVENLNETIQDSVRSVFSDAFNSLDSCNMEITDQVISAQKVSDIVLKKATVVGFNGDEYSAYAKNYAISDEFTVPDLLSISGRGLTQNSINAVVSNARRELNVKVKAAPEPTVIENPVIVAPEPVVVQNPANNAFEDINAEYKVDEEAQRKAEEEAKRKAEEEEAQRKSEEEAKRKAEEEEAQRKSEEEAKRKAEEEEAQRKSEEEAKKKAEEEEAQRKSEEEAKKKAEADPAAEEARRLNVQKAVEKAIEEDKTPDMNSRLRDWCQAAINDNTLTEDVNIQLSAVTGKTDNLNVSVARSRMLNKVSRIPETVMLRQFRMAYQTKTNMNSLQATIEMAKSVFSEAFKHTDNCDYSLVERVYVAQEMTDVLMKNYSPAAFVPKVFDIATDYYLIPRAKTLATEVQKHRSDFSSKHREKIKDYGLREKGGNGKLDAYRERREQRNRDLKEYLEENRKRGANVSDADYVEDYTVRAYTAQYLNDSGDNDKIKASKEKAKAILAKIGVPDTTQAVDKFFDGIMYDMQRVYDNAAHFADHDGTFGDMMTYVSREVFHLAYSYTKVYQSDGARHLAITQQLTDVILEDYSPAKYNDAHKVNYTKNFVIGDANNLKYVLDKNGIKLSDEQINKLLDNVAYANEHLEEVPGKDQVDIIAEQMELDRQKQLEEEKAREEQEILEEQKRAEERQRKLEEQIRLQEEQEQREKEKLEEQKRIEEEKRKLEEQKALEKQKQLEEKKKLEEKYEHKVVEKYEHRVKRIDLYDKDSNNLFYGNVTKSLADLFRSKCKLNSADPELTAYVKSQIGEILLNSGVEKSKIQKTIDNVFGDSLYHRKDGMIAVYESLRKEMRDDTYTPHSFMRAIIKQSVKAIHSATDGCFSSIEEGVVANQKILDVILKNYSPAAFVVNDLSKYTDNYLFKAEGIDLLNDVYDRNYTKSGFKNREDFLKRVDDAYKKANKIDVGKEPAVKDNKKPAPVKEQISVDLTQNSAPKVDVPKTDAPKTDAPKTEAPKTEASKAQVNDPAKERLVLNELSESVGGTEVSARVDVHNAPVTSKSKE